VEESFMGTEFLCDQGMFIKYQKFGINYISSLVTDTYISQD